MTDSKTTPAVEIEEPTVESLILFRLEHADKLKFERVLFHRLNHIIMTATGTDLTRELSTLDKLEFLRCIVAYHQIVDADFNDDFSGNFFDLLN